MTKKQSFRPSDTPNVVECDKHRKKRYVKRYGVNTGPEKTVKHVRADHTNPSREDHVSRILGTKI